MEQTYDALIQRIRELRLLQKEADRTASIYFFRKAEDAERKIDYEISMWERSQLDRMQTKLNFNEK